MADPAPHQHDDHAFDRPYWDRHWAEASHDRLAASPYLAEETAHLKPGTALDAGCGAGAEAIWLVTHGWDVTGVDISAAALAAARENARRACVTGRLSWVEADLLAWEPAQRWDLVVTCYAHAAIPQLDLYQRLSDLVAPGGTLLVIAHGSGDAEHHYPREAEVSAADVAALFAASSWTVRTSTERARTVTTREGELPLHDVVVRVERTA
ncbi:class I SAM-dependent methyltransferase [Georgenia sp. 311]|uniref:class I SAM-dependent methyltransferase n=1 Tax=Georgenia sp. 311 TaxID=2585134 RepID=UPI00111256E8|nr:class I SAM-dependent methyltransferase [Georgenia sp. 311]TNC16626.1 class I SAM-dependent methyltransferase [Georgenia sp. 311]